MVLFKFNNFSNNSLSQVNQNNLITLYKVLKKDSLYYKTDVKLLNVKIIYNTQTQKYNIVLKKQKKYSRVKTLLALPNKNNFESLIQSWLHFLLLSSSYSLKIKNINVFLLNSLKDLYEEQQKIKKILFKTAIESGKINKSLYLSYLHYKLVIFSLSYYFMIYKGTYELLKSSNFISINKFLETVKLKNKLDSLSVGTNKLHINSLEAIKFVSFVSNDVLHKQKFILNEDLNKFLQKISYFNISQFEKLKLSLSYISSGSNKIESNELQLNIIRNLNWLLSDIYVKSDVFMKETESFSSKLMVIRDKDLLKKHLSYSIKNYPKLNVFFKNYWYNFYAKARFDKKLDKSLNMSKALDLHRRFLLSNLAINNQSSNNIQNKVLYKKLIRVFESKLYQNVFDNRRFLKKQQLMYFFPGYFSHFSYSSKFFNFPLINTVLVGKPNIWNFSYFIYKRFSFKYLYYYYKRF